jgi:hypothetical protein
MNPAAAPSTFNYRRDILEVTPIQRFRCRKDFHVA